MKPENIILGIMGIAAVVLFGACNLTADGDYDYIFYEGPNSSYPFGDARELTINNEQGATVWYAYLVDSDDTSVNYSDDLLESYVVSSGQTKTIVGVPNDNAALDNTTDIELTFIDKNGPKALFGPFDFVNNNYDLTILVETNDSDQDIIQPRSISDPNISVLEKDGFIVTIKARPKKK